MFVVRGLLILGQARHEKARIEPAFVHGRRDPVRANNECIEAEAQLFAVQHLSQRERARRQRDEFLAMLAHELRNPLAPIRNAVHLLGTLEYSDPLFLKCRAIIEKQTSHVTRLVDDLLDVSRLELGKVALRMQRVNLNETLAAAADACAPLTSARSHAVNIRPWKHPLAVRADPMRLEQVIGT